MATLADITRDQFERYDSETGTSQFNKFGYNMALGQLGYIPTSTKLGLWKSPETLNWFNQNYGTNFSDPSSYLNYLYGDGGQLIDDPTHGQLYQLPQGRMINDYINKPLSYEKSDWFDTVIPGIIGSVAAAGLGGFLPGTESVFGGTAGAGATGSGAFGGDIAGTAFAGEGLSGGLGGGMGFFDDILNWVSPNNSGFDFSNILSDTGSFAGEFSPLSTDWESLLQTIGSGNATLGGVFNSLTGGGLPSLGNSLRGLLGGGSGTGGGGLLGGLFGGTGGGFNPAATAAALAAINYAKNTDPFDTSRLESLYGQFNPSANAFQYDTNTGLGREELTSGLARRGISGSSFGDQSLTNYNTFRDLGRQSLLNQGIGTQADIASKILSSDVASRQMKNDLYGRALLALSGGLSPTNTSAFFGR